MVQTKGDKHSFGRWETFLVSTVRTKIALVACCTGFCNHYAALFGCSLVAKLIALWWSLELLMRNVPGNWQDKKIQIVNFLSISATLSIEWVQGLVVLLRCSRLLKNSFLPCRIENGQLLQYGHAYLLSVCENTKTHVCILLRIHAYCRTVRKRKRYTSKQSYKQNGMLIFIDRYCIY